MPYYSYGILTRFMASHSAALETQTHAPGIAAAAVRSPQGNLTIYVLNHSEAPRQLTVSVQGLDKTRVLYKYQVGEWSVGTAWYHMNPLRSVQISPDAAEFTDELTGQSITAYSSYKLLEADPGITVEGLP